MSCATNLEILQDDGTLGWPIVCRSFVFDVKRSLRWKIDVMRDSLDCNHFILQKTRQVDRDEEDVVEE